MTESASPILQKTRLAPTPSGFLHVGNIYSFALTAALAHKNKAAILLRIDDLDQKRVRDDYLEDIFESLSFLDIPWNEGPRNSREFRVGYSQLLRRNNYAGALAELREKDLLYACACSRNKPAGPGKNETCECRSAGLPFDRTEVSWKLRTEPGERIKIKTPQGFIESELPVAMRDPIVRKKDGNASYQLSSVVDDVFFGIDLVVRGEDLSDSSLIQLYIAGKLGYDAFLKATFIHHKLLRSENGDKLSKSAGDTSVNYLRKKGLMAEDVYRIVGRIAGIADLTHWRDL